MAKGFTQVEGADYNEIFTPTLKSISLRILLALATHNMWNIKQIDIKCVFLNGTLDKEIYIEIIQGEENKNGFWKLKKALYGLKQASRVWNNTITNFQKKNCNLKQYINDECIFFSIKNEKLKGILTIYVDDMLIGGEEEFINKVSNNIKKV